MYTETLNHIAEKGVGSTIFIDSSASAQDKVMQQFAGLMGAGKKDLVKEVFDKEAQDLK